MNRLKQLLPAEFKKVPFLVRNEIMTEAGRRIVLHDYPNSNKRFVEDLGQIPKKFSVTAFVSGNDFMDKANKLEAALKEKGSGILFIPTFGSAEVYALPYKKDAAQSEVGEIKFELSFVAGTAFPGPQYGDETKESVYAKGQIVRQQSATFLESLWISPKETIQALSAQYDLEKYASAIGGLVTAIDVPTDLEGTIDLILLNSHTLVRDGGLLADTWVRDLWQAASVGLEGGKAISELLVLAGWGNAEDLGLSEVFGARYPPLFVPNPAGTVEIPLWPTTTTQRIKRNENRLNLINTGRLNALTIAYEQSADKEYQTDLEIDETRADLESVHEIIMRDDTDDRSLIQSQPEVRQSVESLRLAALNVLDQKEQATFILTQIDNQVQISSFAEAYQLYAEDLKISQDITDRAIIIRDLNPSMASDKLIGNTTVIQQ